MQLTFIQLVIVLLLCFAFITGYTYFLAKIIYTYKEKKQSQLAKAVTTLILDMTKDYLRYKAQVEKQKEQNKTNQN